jgi:hypothetical protein
MSGSFREVRPTAKKHISIEMITQAFLDIG